MVGTGSRLQELRSEAHGAGRGPRGGATAVPPPQGWRMPRGSLWRLVAWWDRPSRHLLLSVLLVAAAAAAPLSVQSVQAQTPAPASAPDGDRASPAAAADAAIDDPAP